MRAMGMNPTENELLELINEVKIAFVSINLLNTLQWGSLARENIWG